MHVIATIVGFICFIFSIKLAWDADDGSSGPYVQFASCVFAFFLILVGVALVAWGVD